MTSKDRETGRDEVLAFFLAEAIARPRGDLVRDALIDMVARASREFRPEAPPLPGEGEAK